MRKVGVWNPFSTAGVDPCEKWVSGILWNPCEKWVSGIPKWVSGIPKWVSGIPKWVSGIPGIPKSGCLESGVWNPEKWVSGIPDQLRGADRAHLQRAGHPQQVVPVPRDPRDVDPLAGQAISQCFNGKKNPLPYFYGFFLQKILENTGGRL